MARKWLPNFWGWPPRASLFRDLFRRLIFWCILVAIWLTLGSFWLHLGSFWLPFGALWLPFGSVWLPFGSLWLSFGSLWLPFGSLWLTFGSLLVSFGSLLLSLGRFFIFFMHFWWKCHAICFFPLKIFRHPISQHTCRLIEGAILRMAIFLPSGPERNLAEGNLDPLRARRRPRRVWIWFGRSILWIPPF